MPFDVNDVENALASIDKKVTEAIQKTNEEVQAHGKIGKKNEQVLDRLSNEIKELTASVLELEQRGTSQNDINNNIKSVGAQFTDSDTFKSFQAGNSTKATFEVENNSQLGSDATVAPDRRGGVVSGAFRKLRLMDVMPQGSTTSNAIEYTRENLFDNKAIEVAEGKFAYPESDITFELVSVPVRNIGHVIPISKQFMEDAVAVASYIDGRMRYGVEFRKDQQALTGNGSGQNLNGIFNTGNYINIAGASEGDKQYKNIRRAIAQVELADYSAEAIILNPADCADIDLIEGTDGHFISANPRIQSIKTLWGLPVVETNAMPAGKFLLGALSMAVQFTTRRGVIVEMSESDGENFKQDMVTLKASCRGAVEIYRPASMVGGDLITPAAG